MYLNKVVDVGNKKKYKNCSLVVKQIKFFFFDYLILYTNMEDIALNNNNNNNNQLTTRKRTRNVECEICSNELGSLEFIEECKNHFIELLEKQIIKKQKK